MEVVRHHKNGHYLMKDIVSFERCSLICFYSTVLDLKSIIEEIILHSVETTQQPTLVTVLSLYLDIK